MKNSQQNNRGELQWTAFCYVAGELDEREAAEFETRLADDQAAREAVAAAVELAQTVSAAEHLVELPVVATAAREASRWRRVAWLAVAGSVAACCACLLLVAAMRIRVAPEEGVAGPNPPVDSAPVSRDGESPDVKSRGVESPALATAWLEALDQEVALDASRAEERWEFEASLTGEGLLVEGPDPAAAAAPDWMVSALSGMSGIEVERGTGEEWEN